jgi:Ni/Co efflux regulator RcnB
VQPDDERHYVCDVRADDRVDHRLLPRDDRRDVRRDDRWDRRADRRDDRWDRRADRRDHRRDDRWDRRADRRDYRWDRGNHYGWDRGKHYGWRDGGHKHYKHKHKRWHAGHHPRHRSWAGRRLPRTHYVVIERYNDYYLPPPRRGHYYARVDNDVFLVAQATHLIVDAFVLLDAASRN